MQHGLDVAPEPDPDDLGTLERLGDSTAWGDTLLAALRGWGWRVDCYTLFAGTGWGARATHPDHGAIAETRDSYAAVAGAVFCAAAVLHHAARVAA